ncbi:unnamed protein product [Prunus armeniaca]
MAQLFFAWTCGGLSCHVHKVPHRNITQVAPPKKPIERVLAPRYQVIVVGILKADLEFVYKGSYLGVL